MLIFLFVISLILFIVFLIFLPKFLEDYDTEICTFLVTGMFLSGIGLIVIPIAFFVNWSKYVEYCHAEERIELVEAKNTDIENEIQQTVREYMEHEHKTYKDLSPNNAIAVASAYPDLSSNELIKEQISTYKSNRDEILQLKQHTIDRKIKAWWLWFGK